MPNEVRVKLSDALLPAGLVGERDNAPHTIVFGHYWMEWPLVPLAPIYHALR